jgi:hypothetical protein
MNFKRVLALAMTLCLALCLCACGGEEKKETSAETTQATAATAAPETQPTEAAPIDPVDEGKATYVITVVDESGKPVVGAGVQLCKDTCLPGITNDQGTAEFKVAEDPEYKVSFMSVPEGYEGAEEAYYFENGSYELTITLIAPAVNDGKALYTVKVVDEGGNPVVGAGVQLCKDTCLPAITDEDGIAEFRVAEDPEYKVSFMSVPEGYEGAEEAYYFESGSYELVITLKAVA